MASRDGQRQHKADLELLSVSRGMKSRVGLKSIPVDFLVLDEMDEASPSAVDMAMERMSHSEFGRF